MKGWIKILLTIFLLNIQGDSYAQRSDVQNQYVNITDIKLNGKLTFISVDVIQMLTGKAAVNAAKKAGEAEHEVNKKGDTTWYVPNDFYILNANNNIRKFEISPKASIYLLKNNSSYLQKSTIRKLSSIFEEQIFIISTSKNKIVTIKQIYTP